MKVVIILVVLCCGIIASFAAPTCTGTGLCQSCSDTATTCGGKTYPGQYSCANVTSGINSSDNPCNLAYGQSICVGAPNLNSTDVTNFNTYYFNLALQGCQNNSNGNPTCCTSPTCPITCSGVSTTTYTYTAPAPNVLLCFDQCTSCNGAGLTTAYCNANCGKSGSIFQCSTNSTCCDAGSASSLTSFLSYFF